MNNSRELDISSFISLKLMTMYQNMIFFNSYLFVRVVVGGLLGLLCILSFWTWWFLLSWLGFLVYIRWTRDVRLRGVHIMSEEMYGYKTMVFLFNDELPYLEGEYCMIIGEVFYYNCRMDLVDGDGEVVVSGVRRMIVDRGRLYLEGSEGKEWLIFTFQYNELRLRPGLN